MNASPEVAPTVLNHCNDEGKDGSTSTEDYPSLTDSRDEVQEIRNVAKRDTTNVVVWRYITTTVLLLTAVAVTLTTYYFLQRQQIESFETQFEQFSRTVADAALEQQEQARLAYRGFADALTAISQDTPGVWPYFDLPRYESFASNTMKQAHTEVTALFSLVRHDQRDDWVNFVNRTHVTMVDRDHMIRYGNLDRLNPVGYHPYISTPTPNGFVPDIERDFYFPVRHFAPAPGTYGFINWNAYADAVYGPLFDELLEMKTEQLISKVKPYSAAAGIAFTQEEHADMHKHVHLVDSAAENPHSFMFTPVYERIEDPDAPIVAIVGCAIPWDFFMVGLLPEGVNGISVVMENNCDQSYTYEINGPNVKFLGEGDHHDSEFEDLMTYQDLTEGFHSHPQYEEMENHCRFALRIYPTSVFHENLDPFVPEIFAIVVAATFVVVAMVFYVYDLFVNRRNEKLIANAAQSNAIVTSLFPSNIRDRLLPQKDVVSSAGKSAQNLKGFMVGSEHFAEAGDSKPLADLFLECTVMFADISGFTAWSSVREPSQVFTILETVYTSFDHIAKIRRVFKVETVGDCYVAATGIPDFRKDHAVTMIRFARDIIEKFSTLTKELERILGPDTGDLSLRVGVHTGPVTAGVLRGERARFQLFGDTTNVCNHIESSGMAGRIHVSTETADNLRSNGKAHWLIMRENRVHVKGKGEVQTYWIGCGVERDRREGSAVGSSERFDRDRLDDVFEPEQHSNANQSDGAKMNRLVEWNVEMLAQIMKQIVSRRNANNIRASPRKQPIRSRNKNKPCEDFSPLDEVEEIIPLPEFDAKVARLQEDPDKVVLPMEVLDQLRNYVTIISGLYRDNAFHSFDHASHVTMSVVKLLSRIVAPSEDDLVTESEHSRRREATLHDHTYGITSDPMTQFSCAFAAMIHDVDHTGVPNAQLVKEGTRIAQLYKNRSVAEQNSLVLAWELLMMSDFDALRSMLCANQSELDRFRQLVVNAVMATDIVDKDLKALRNARWDKAFTATPTTEDGRDAVNRKATIVIEHLIQASDVAHTMQHWHIYRKWNESFFRECYAAYLAGRAEKDPSVGWYKGEIGFFDFYIIPLAKKLKECGVFGKSSDEYLTYAVANRNEWERRGESVVAEILEAVQSENTEGSKELGP